MLGVQFAIGGLTWVLKPELVRYLPFLNVVWVFVSVFPIRRPKPVSISLPGADDAFAVRMTVVDRIGEQTGSDCGTLIFCDGWLLFEGARTEFAVTRGEAWANAPGTSVNLTLEDRRTVRLTLPLEASGYKPFNEAFSRWNLQPIPDGEAVLPPREIHPEVWVERWTWCVIGLIACLAVTGMAFAFGLPLWAAYALLPAAGCAWGARLLSTRLGEELPRVLGAASALEPWQDRPGLVPDAPALPSERGEEHCA